MIGLISVDKVGDENFAWTYFGCTIFLSLEHYAKPVRKKCFWLNLICTDSFEPVYWSQSAQNISTIASSKSLDFNLLKLVLIISFQFLTRKNHFKVMIWRLYLGPTKGKNNIHESHTMVYRGILCSKKWRIVDNTIETLLKERGKIFRRWLL